MMDALNFAYWLQGFVELTQGQTPCPAQWKAIKEHLDLVFKKVTPPVGEFNPTKIPTSFDLEEALRKYREGQLIEPFPFIHDGTGRPVVTC
ncbi:hypothetical protein [Burkholderia pseudomallei]|uniref:hypothetical protein n=1 Tax=Burkholderia pseudomallei TaxID=28450 RepID=UPI0012F52AD1|nr:hypothetical protein [Burkholderia pseudomallei]